MEEEKARITFWYTDTDGSETNGEAELTPCYEFGDTDLSECIDRFHGFLGFVGYIVGECFLQEPLTFKERDALLDYLEEYRRNDLHRE